MATKDPMDKYRAQGYAMKGDGKPVTPKSTGARANITKAPAALEAQRQADLKAMKKRGEHPYVKISTKSGDLIDNPYDPDVDPKYDPFGSKRGPYDKATLPQPRTLSNPARKKSK